MTDKEKIISAIATIDSMLTLDFMTDPVREDLNKIKKNITNKIIQTKKTKVDNSGIPPSTLKLIEEAENN